MFEDNYIISLVYEQYSSNATIIFSESITENPIINVHFETINLLEINKR